MPDDKKLAAELIAVAKAEAERALWASIGDVVKDTQDARAKLARISDDLASVWVLRLSGQDTSEEEEWLDREAKLVAARLGLQGNAAAKRALVTTANILLGIGSSFLSAFLKIPIQLPTIPGGVPVAGGGT